MIQYSIIHHIPGRIRIKVPEIKKLSFSELKKFSRFPMPEGIYHINANPLNGSVIISYDPNIIDVRTFLAEITRRETLRNLLEEMKSSAGT